MFKKIFTALAITCFLGITPALAQHHGPGGHFGGGHGPVVGGGHFGGPAHFGGPGHFGGYGHFWHGRWWEYGVGPCWVLTPAGYVWNPLVCVD